MKARRTAVGVLLAGLVAPSLARPDEMPFWQRARAGGAAERSLRAALDREAEGHADERDLLRLRTAVVEMGRGQLPRNAATTVLLVHYRIELGSLDGGLEVAGAGAVGKKSFDTLGRVLVEPIGPEMRALAHLDRARLLRAGVSVPTGRGGEPGAATGELELALETAIDADTLARAHFLLGLDRLEASRGEARELERAEAAFSAARSDGAGARLRAASWAGSAWVASARSRSDEAESLTRTAAAVLAGAPASAASSLGEFLWLRPTEIAHFQALWARGRELSRLGVTSVEPADSADAACAVLDALGPSGDLVALRPGVAWLGTFCGAPQPSTSRPRPRQ